MHFVGLFLFITENARSKKQKKSIFLHWLINDTIFEKKVIEI
jgi:hypothetical protein